MRRHRRKRVVQATPAPAVQTTLTDSAKKYNGTRIFVLVFAIVSVVAILGAIIASAIISALRSEKVDYLNDDLSKYIYIAPEDYRSYDVYANVDPIDELAVEDSIMQMLYMYREDGFAFDGQWLVNLPKNEEGEVTRLLSIGDVVEYRYRAYLIREDGSREDLGQGFCNLDSEEPIELNIGEGTTYLGFEYGFIGRDHGEHSSVSEVSDRAIKEGDFIKLTYSKVEVDSHQESVTEFISVKAEDCDPKYGEGFADFLIGKELGTTDDYFIVTGEDGKKSSYLGVRVDKIYDVGDNPMTIEARTSVNEDDENLRGKTIYYDVYVERVKLIEEVPVLDPLFIEQKIGVSSAELEKYKGDTLDEKFRSYVVEGLEKSRESELADVIEEQMWEHYRKKVKIKRLPEGEVLEYYDDYVAELTAQYNAAADNYNSIEEYAMLHLELDRDANWLDYMRSLAERAVSEKIIFYYIIRNDKLLPNEKEYKELYDLTVAEYLEAFLKNVGCTKDKYKTEEEYNSAVESYKQSMFKVYSEEYFEENVIFLHAIEKLRGYANVIYDR